MNLFLNMCISLGKYNYLLFINTGQNKATHIYIHICQTSRVKTCQTSRRKDVFRSALDKLMITIIVLSVTVLLIFVKLNNSSCSEENCVLLIV